MGELYGLRSERDGELQGWFHGERFDLFLWFEGDALVHLQVCAGNDVVDWKPSGLLPTASLRGRDSGGVGVQAARTDQVVEDHFVSAKRLERAIHAVTSASLPAPVRDFTLGALRRDASTATEADVLSAVRRLRAAG
jgi:hypothetical protein